MASKNLIKMNTDHLPDTAAYWWDIKAPRPQKHVFVHAKGVQCGHFHVCESKYENEIDCHACVTILAEMPPIFNMQPVRPPYKPMPKKAKRTKDGVVKSWNGVALGQTVSHEDYSDELFKVTHIDPATKIITTAGGKNGTWINHIDLIIKNPKR